MRSFVGRLSKNTLVQNTTALYGVQFCRKIIPLISIPYLAMTLGPAGWGTVAFVQSLGDLITLFVEFGFGISATREIARIRDSAEACSDVMAGVLGAQAALCVIGVAGALFIAYWVPLLSGNPRLLLAGLFYALARSFSPGWFFQGLEKMGVTAGLEILGNVFFLCSILLLVRSPEDGWKVLALHGLASCLTTIVTLWLAYRILAFRIPSWPLVRKTLREGWPMFLFRGGGSLYGLGNAFVLGLFAPAHMVGYFAGAEKISNAFFGLLSPIRDALYPRLSNLTFHAPDKAIYLARIGAILMGGAGLIFGLMVFFLAPVLIKVFMGRNFEPAVPVLRILALLPLLLSITSSVGLQCLLPLGRYSVVNRIIITAGILNLVLAFILAPRFAHLGMAWAVVSTEAFVCVSMVWVVVRSTPFWSSQVVSLKHRHP